MICTNCGNPLSPDDVFCGECGQKVDRSQNVAPSNEQQTVHTSTIAPKHEPAQHTYTNTQHHSHQEQPKQNAQPLIDKEQVNIQSRQLVDEGRGFFQQAFKNADAEIASNHHYSLGLNIALILGGLLLTGIIMAIFSSQLLYLFGADKTSAIFKACFMLLIYIAAMIGSTFLLTKLLINPAVTFTKVLSDFVLVNVFSFIIFILGVFINGMDVESSIGYYLLIASSILITYSAFYLFGKYSNNVQPKLPSFVAAILHLIIVGILLAIFKDSFVQMLESFLTNAFVNTVSNYFGN